MFFVTALIALPSAWIGCESQRVREEAIAVKALAAQGGQVLYDFEYLSGDLEESIPRTRFGIPAYSRLFPSVAWVGMHNDGRVSGDTFELLSAFSRLRALDIEYVDVDAADLTKVATLAQLEEVTIVQAGTISDAEISKLRRLRRLRALYIDEDAITDAGILQLGQFPELESIGLRGFRLTDRVGGMIASQPKLKYVYVDDLKVTDNFVASIAPLQNLRVLSLRNTLVTDKSLPDIGKISELRTLDLEETGVTGNGLKNLKQLPHLERLILWGMNVSDAQVAELVGALPNCKVEK